MSTPPSPTSSLTIGVLALQGAFNEHVQLLRRASSLLNTKLPKSYDWKFIEVRTAEQLSHCDALIIPGGESTTISLVAEASGLMEPLRDFVK
jgi:5'-phosphate synthase pdxT subunit